MPRIFGLVAVAVGLATPARGGSDGTTAQVGEGGDPIGDLHAPLGEGFQGFWHHHEGGLFS